MKSMKESMKGTALRLLAASMAIILIFAIAGCKKTADVPAKTAATENQNKQEQPAQTAGQSGGKYWDMLDSVSDSSDLPDWGGKQLNLNLWYASDPTAPYRGKAENNVVTTEIKRVTGVYVDPDKSFDNAGDSADLKMGMMAAANDWPSMAFIGSAGIQPLVENNKIWDLTDLIKENCPHIYNYFLTEKDGKVTGQNLAITSVITAGKMDRIYAIPTYANNSKIMHEMLKRPGIDPNKVSQLFTPSPVNGTDKIWIRDDISKMLYPNSMTMDEIEAKYMANGSFTPEEIYDIPINSKDDFYNLCRNIAKLVKDKNIQENNQPVEAIWANNGGDNWPLMSVLLPTVTGLAGGDSWNYAIDYNLNTNQLEWAWTQDYFKNMVHDFWLLVKDGVAAPESLIDNSQIFDEKLNSGHYAITYAWSKVNENTLKAAGKTYRYRPLWVNIPPTGTFPMTNDPDQSGQYWVIFKDAVPEEDLVQILRYYDYMISEVGTKLHNWGPRSAGLFTETDGKRAYVDDAMVQCKVYGVDNLENQKYGIFKINQSWPTYPCWCENDWTSPAYVYDKVRNVGDVNTYYNAGILPGNNWWTEYVPLNKPPFIWMFLDENNVWQDARDTFEKALKKPLAAKDEAQFNELWDAFKAVAAESQPLTSLPKMNQEFKDANGDDLKLLDKFRK